MEVGKNKSFGSLMNLKILKKNSYLTVILKKMVFLNVFFSIFKIKK